MSDRYTKSFFLTLTTYGIIAIGYITINNSLKPINNLTAKTMYISIINETGTINKKQQEPIPQPLISKKEKKKEETIQTLLALNANIHTKKIKPAQNHTIEKTEESKTVQNSRLDNKTDISNLKDKFLAKVKSDIRANKTYPAIAKNRNIEGKVTAEFTITKDGEAANINITSGNNALKGATRSAIEKSFPQIIPHELKDSFPMSANITLNFDLIIE